MIITLPSLVHEDYLSNREEWQKWRLAYRGGDAFKETYLSKYDARETTADFEDRREKSFNPPVLRTELSKVKNCLVQHLSYAMREGGSDLYQDAVQGSYLGVDKTGRSMHDFLAEVVIEEFLVMSKVGIFIDQSADIGSTKAANLRVRPYLYAYKREQIMSWEPDPEHPGSLKALLLQDALQEYDTTFNLPKQGTKNLFRSFKVVVNEAGYRQVEYKVFTDAALEKQNGGTRYLDLPCIPFVVLELPVALLRDSADMQIALLNLASSDITCCFKANFPVLTENIDTRMASPYLDKGGDGEDEDTVPAGPNVIMQYGQGRNAPAFISPDPGPLKVSMERQAVIERQLKDSIRSLISELDCNGDGSNITGTLPGGLSSIGSMLRRAEVQIAYFWNLYEGRSEKPAIIIYPQVYNIQSDEERTKTAVSLRSLIDAVPSITCKKELSKLIARTLLGGRTGPEVMGTIMLELDQAKFFQVDAKSAEIDVKNGLATKAFISEYGRGYPEGEAGKAAKEDMARIVAIAAAQMKGLGPSSSVAAGVEPMSPADTLAARGISAGGDASKEKTNKNKRGDGK